MSNMPNYELERDIQAKFQQIPPADWVLDMIDHYHRTGSYRPEDLRRLLGDPNKAVEVGPNTSISAYFMSAAGDREKD